LVVPSAWQSKPTSAMPTSCHQPKGCCRAMLLIPAIDLQDGRCVRLRQGNFDESTVFSDVPGAMAAQWVSQGARRLHLVDLDGAVAGKPKNTAAIRAIVDAVDDRIPIQIGGGIRDLDTIEQYLDSGITYVILGN